AIVELEKFVIGIPKFRKIGIVKQRVFHSVMEENVEAMDVEETVELARQELLVTIWVNVKLPEVLFALPGK
ncbi:MAG: hypothetical protein QXI33_03010, partial [Candidatus Pacearchaeota archaeon]